MKMIDKKVRNLGSRPFAAFLLMGLMGFGFDIMLSTGNYTERKIASVVESPFLATTAQAAESPEEKSEDLRSSQTGEAKARLLFKKNEASSFRRHWGERMERFDRFVE